MEDKEVSSGSTAVLECIGAGSPKPRLRWVKDGTALVANDRHFFTQDGQFLIIVQARAQDEGKYECEITNSLGTDKGSSWLRIKPGSSVHKWWCWCRPVVPRLWYSHLLSHVPALFLSL